MKVYINESELDLPQGSYLSDALNVIALKENVFAVALNLQFVARRNYNVILLKAQDKIDIIVPMQGG